MRQSTLMLLIVLQFNLYGQDVENRIKDVRAMYQEKVQNRLSYIMQEQDITSHYWVYDGEGDDSESVTLTSYFSNDNIMITEVMREQSNMWYRRLTTIEYYYKSDSIFFIYNVASTSNYVHGETGIKIDNEFVNEKRFYFAENGKCIRYLSKEFEGKPNVIDSLRNITKNIELSCEDIQYYIDEAKQYLSKE